MKKILSVLTLFLIIIACDDGDIAIETIDFDSVTEVQYCGGVLPNSKNVLFKINNDEALILELHKSVIENIEKDSMVFDVTAAGDTKIIYRIFSDNVSKDYFCNDIPLTEPVVLNEIIAESGDVIITTTLDNETYTHDIKLRGISLVTSNNSRITYLSINEFGVVTTEKEVTPQE